ncbi:hypothetical protein BD311DRAFT_673927 [Dichomitus squalens]|uniref:Uncharacterized protein n=1 Tax=Dichomitus squalens TaxID=114155 RepID=A0A4Q9MAA9_9APHY|nr:hypothetical protein BD311DRAFT_673927 [Dichomitus squalens]
MSKCSCCHISHLPVSEDGRSWPSRGLGFDPGPSNFRYKLSAVKVSVCPSTHDPQVTWHEKTVTAPKSTRARTCCYSPADHHQPLPLPPQFLNSSSSPYLFLLGIPFDSSFSPRSMCAGDSQHSTVLLGRWLNTLLPGMDVEMGLS